MDKRAEVKTREASSFAGEAPLVEGQFNYQWPVQGNIYGWLNECSKKIPTAGLLMAVMFQLTADICTLLATHVKRDFNQWADDLTHPSFHGFDGTLQLPVAPLLDDFKIFPWILQHLDEHGSGRVNDPE